MGAAIIDAKTGIQEELSLAAEWVVKNIVASRWQALDGT